MQRICSSNRVQNDLRVLGSSTRDTVYWTNQVKTVQVSLSKVIYNEIEKLLGCAERLISLQVHISSDCPIICSYNEVELNKCIFNNRIYKLNYFSYQNWSSRRKFDVSALKLRDQFQQQTRQADGQADMVKSIPLAIVFIYKIYVYILYKVWNNSLSAVRTPAQN